jgi:N-acyl amino acid synthase of PEP-CTERM/exosortase system
MGALGVGNEPVTESIFEIFEKYFCLVPVTSPALLLESQKVRYSVYCLEHHFEKEEDHPTQIEEDCYDPLSAHTLLQHTLSQDFAATVRLVLPQALSDDGLFPIEKHCCFDDEKNKMIREFPRANLAEISRFAVSKSFRKRLGEAQTSHGLTNHLEDHEGKRLIPHITLGLFKSIVRMSVENDIHYWYAVMEVMLIRLLKRFGMHFIQIGPAVEYHGKRIPCWTNAKEMLEGIHKKRPDVWDFITESGKYKL